MNGSIQHDSLGIIAGMGKLPEIIAHEAKKKGMRVATVALKELAGDGTKRYSDEIERISIGRLSKIIDFFKARDITKVVMAGKAPKELLYKNTIVPDMRIIKILLSIKDRKDDTIMHAVTQEIEKEGIKVLNITDFAGNYLAEEGVLTRRRPSRSEEEDIAFGFKIAKEIGRLDIGQTVVVKDKAVMAVEAIEGTDEAIRRGGRFAKKGGVVVKVSKPSQDLRFDVPVVGMDTLNAMQESHLNVLAVEAGTCIILDRDELTHTADKYDISITGVRF